MILDLGCGQGSFLVEAAAQGARAIGVEINQAYIELAQKRACEAGISIDIRRGVAEHLPFADGAFSFVNMSEVIEHVQDPEQVLREMSRILSCEGCAYISAPNRYGMKDQHFHLYGVNWLPRRMADTFIRIFGKHKDYTDANAGRQRLADMHYYTYESIGALSRAAGFEVIDIRMQRVNEMTPVAFRLAVRLVYRCLRAVVFDSFHLLLTKP